jgi:hypothetical protein
VLLLAMLAWSQPTGKTGEGEKPLANLAASETRLEQRTTMLQPCERHSCVRRLRMQKWTDTGFAFPISWGYNERRSCAKVYVSLCTALRKETVPVATVHVLSCFRPISSGEPLKG